MKNICCICESIVYPGHGSLYIKNDMRNLWFCRSKCKKNFKYKKNPLFLRWTRVNRKKRGIVLNKKIFLDCINYKKIENLKKYDEYLISHVLYQLNRCEQLQINRAKDYKYFKKSTKYY